MIQSLIIWVLSRIGHSRRLKLHVFDLVTLGCIFMKLDLGQGCKEPYRQDRRRFLSSFS